MKKLKVQIGGETYEVRGQALNYYSNGQIHIGPACESIFQVPLAFTVAHQDEFMHEKV